MNSIVAKSWLVAVVGMVLLTAQGCGTKWFKSGGETESGSAQSGSPSGSSSGSSSGSAGSTYPQISGGSSSGELSGFSHNPSEERLTQSQSSFSTSLSPSELSARRRAELTKEEKAALEAGLQDVFFGYDQWTLSNVGMDALNRDAAYLKDHPGAVLKIEGHCDERGTSEYNIVLGDKRAKAARSYLVESGVSPKQVAIVSYGKERPFCFDHEESCYQQNRRGHMLLGTKK